MSMLSLTLPEGRKHYEPGQEIEITAEWDLDEDATAIELRAVWRTSGKGDTDIGVADTLRFDQPNRNETRRTTFRLPTAPYSFSGQLVSLSWKLELVALPAETFDQCDITIAPSGREVLLSEVSDNDDVDSEDANKTPSRDEF